MGGRVFVSPGLNPLHFPRYRRFVADLLHSNPEIRILHAHNEAMGYYALQSAKDAGLPVRIAHAHNTQIIRDYKYPLKLVCKQLLPGAATDYWSCGRDAGIYYYGEKRWRESGFILHNAIDVSRFAFRRETRERLRRLHGLEDCYVIENVAIDGVVAIQDASGRVYLLAPGEEPRYECGSLAEYLKKIVED